MMALYSIKSKKPERANFFMQSSTKKERDASSSKVVSV